MSAPNMNEQWLGNSYGGQFDADSFEQDMDANATAILVATGVKAKHNSDEGSDFEGNDSLDATLEEFGL